MVTHVSPVSETPGSLVPYSGKPEALYSETPAGLVYMVEGPVGIAKGARQGVPQVDRMILLMA